MDYANSRTDSYRHFLMAVRHHSAVEGKMVFQIAKYQNLSIRSYVMLNVSLETIINRVYANICI